MNECSNRRVDEWMNMWADRRTNKCKNEKVGD